MSKRSHEMQLWADKAFCRKLEQLKAEMTLMGRTKIRSKGDLTRLIINTAAWKQVEDEIKQTKRIGGIKFDGLM